MDNLPTDNAINFSHNKLSIYNFGDNFLSEKSNIDQRFFEGGIRYRDAVQIIVATGEYWIFDYGVVVFWAVDEAERQALISRLKNDNTTHIKKIEEHLCFTFANELSIKKDIITLPDNDPLTRLAISHALAQSNKLMEYEIQAQSKIMDYSHIPEELAKFGKISISQKEIAKIRGTLLSTKSKIIIHYGLLDTPDFFWEYPEYEATYERMARYMDIRQRVELLSKKLSTIHELFEMLASEQKHQHSSFLEWIIIVLIGIEIVLFCVQELKDLVS
jgi:uncharacterized Rmd1/YagE family protein